VIQNFSADRSAPGGIDVRTPDRPTFVIADDFPIVALALSDSLAQRYKIAGVVTSLDDLEVVIRTRRPNVLLLDLCFGRRSALPLIPVVLAACQQVRIIVLTAYAEPALASAALEAGASAYVLKASTASELHIAISEVLEGRTYVSDLSKGMAAVDVARIVSVPVSARDRRLLESLHAGRTQREVGAEARITVKAVEKRLKLLRGLVGFRRTPQLLRWFVKWRDKLPPTT
jgi:DNA-binding NarL/FixJ family response regulator